MSRRTLIVLGILAVVWGVPRVLAVHTNWLWFADLVIEAVYRTRLLAQGTLFILGGVAAFAVLLGSVAMARRLGDQAVGGLDLPGNTTAKAVGSFLSKVPAVGGGRV